MPCASAPTRASAQACQLRALRPTPHLTNTHGSKRTQPAARELVGRASHLTHTGLIDGCRPSEGGLRPSELLLSSEPGAGGAVPPLASVRCGLFGRFLCVPHSPRTELVRLSLPSPHGSPAAPQPRSDRRVVPGLRPLHLGLHGSPESRPANPRRRAVDRREQNPLRGARRGCGRGEGARRVGVHAAHVPRHLARLQRCVQPVRRGEGHH